MNKIKCYLKSEKLDQYPFVAYNASITPKFENIDWDEQDEKTSRAIELFVNICLKISHKFLYKNHKNTELVVIGEYTDNQIFKINNIEAYYKNRLILTLNQILKSLDNPISDFLCYHQKYNKNHQTYYLLIDTDTQKIIYPILNLDEILIWKSMINPEYFTKNYQNRIRITGRITTEIFNRVYLADTKMSIQ